MKKRIEKLLKAKEEEKRSLLEKAQTSEDVAELRSINSNIEKINSEIEEFRSMLSSLPADTGEGEELEARSQTQVQGTPSIGSIVATYGMGGTPKPEERATDPYDTMEYRSAFRDYVLNGTVSETIRAATAVADVGPVIPTTIVNKIVERMSEYGRIFSRVTKTSMKGGVQIPISSVKPTATWVTNNNMSAEQKKGISGTIQFAYHKLQCRVAVDLIADTVSLPMFEQLLISNIDEAMVVAIEGAIIAGDGIGKPLGIINDTAIPVEQVIEIAEADISKYKTWTTILGKMPRKYRKGMCIIMNDSDWTQHILGMVDSNGQPVGRVTYGLNGEEKEALLGKEVIAIEDHIPAMADAVAGDVIGILVNLKDYVFNSNLQMAFKKYFDENTDEWKYKNTLIADGKLADRNGVVLIKKKAV